MLRRKNSLSLVALTVIAIAIATVAVTYAVQTILSTREVSATASIVLGGENLRVCTEADDFCETPFTGPVSFGDLRAGSTKNVVLHIKNTADPPAAGDSPEQLLVDGRIRFNAVVYELVMGLVPDLGVIRVISADVPSLGHFEIQMLTPNLSIRQFDDDLDPGQVRRLAIAFTAEAGLSVQVLNFDILIDSVDVPE